MHPVPMPAACSCAITSARLTVSRSSGEHDLEHVPVALGEIRDGQVETEGGGAEGLELREVGPGEGASPSGERVKVRQLAEAHARGDISQVVFAADQRDIHAVVAGTHNPLQAVLLGELGLGLVVQHEQPPSMVVIFLFAWKLKDTKSPNVPIRLPCQVLPND